MEEIQFTGAILMSLLTFALAFLLPRQVTSNTLISRSRWLMAGSTALIAAHFVLQYLFQFRNLSVTMGILVNLLFFIPASWLLNLSILCLQHRNRMDWKVWLPGLLSWVITLALLIVTIITDNKPLTKGSVELRYAEYVSGIVFCTMTAYYSVMLIIGNFKLRRTLNNYYDYEIESLMYWMKRNVIALAVFNFSTPFFIFAQGLIPLAYALLVYFFIYYLVLCFICHVVSNNSLKVNIAERNALRAKMDEKHNQSTMSANDMQRVAAIVDRWVEKGSYLKSGITMQTVVTDMHIPRYQLAAWLKTTEWELFNPWLTHLRIEEAKRLLKEHPDWSNDAIAHQCGFASRSYFQNVFHKQTGMTPSEFVER